MGTYTWGRLKRFTNSQEYKCKNLLSELIGLWENNQYFALRISKIKSCSRQQLISENGNGIYLKVKKELL